MKSSNLKTIHLVDDDEISTYLNSLLLKNHFEGLAIKTYSLASDLLSYLEHEILSDGEVILMDVNMPYMDAWEFLIEAKNRKDLVLEELPLVLLSSQYNPRDKVRIEEFNFSEKVLEKPLQLEEFKKVLELYSIIFSEL